MFGRLNVTRMALFSMPQEQRRNSSGKFPWPPHPADSRCQTRRETRKGCVGACWPDIGVSRSSPLLGTLKWLQFTSNKEEVYVLLSTWVRCWTNKYMGKIHKSVYLCQASFTRGIFTHLIQPLPLIPGPLKVRSTEHILFVYGMWALSPSVQRKRGVEEGSGCQHSRS